MDELNPPFNQDELSEEDLEVLRAFHSNEEPTPGNPLSREPALGASQAETAQSPTLMSDDEMLVLFATEADEDIATMRLALQRLGQDDRSDAQSLNALKRCAHKVAGTAAAIGCDSMSTIAHHMETVIKLVEGGSLVDLTGSIALVHALQALELTLQSIASNGYESKAPLLELEAEFEALSLDIHAVDTAHLSSSKDAETSPTHSLSRYNVTAHHPLSSVRVDPQHLSKLIEHTEKLIEIDTPLEHAQKQVETALSELQVAQARLRRLEPLLSSLSATSNATLNALPGDIGYPPSSLVARILQEAAQRTGHIPQARSTTFTQPLLIQDAALWDEMEIDRFSETNVLAHSLTEAITDVALATSHVRQALDYLKTIVARQVSHASAARNEALLLRSSPFSVLVTRLIQAVEMMTGEQKERVQFESSGESIEINQDILELLTDPLLELLQIIVAEWLYFAKKAEQSAEQTYRIWLKAHAIGNELTIEIGFSQSVSPAAMTALQQTAHFLYGSVSLKEHTVGGTILQLRLPRSQRIVQGLLVRAGEHRVIVPVSQVRRIDYHGQEIGKKSAQVANSQNMPLGDTHEIYHLSTLFGSLPGNSNPEKTIQAALVLESNSPHIAVEVDEVVGEVVLVMKPLAAHLCRPGIASSAIDGNGNVLLVVNLPELIRLNGELLYAGEIAVEAGSVNKHEILAPRPTTPLRRKILIADDSVSMRQSIITTLNYEGYDVLEATDGVQALEQLAQETPDVLLLDIEMPNLNGYDVLNIIRTRQEFSGLHIVMLTSRSSEKHKRRARDLGAHAYLTKPCPQELLLQTITSLLDGENLPINI
jgi:chemosensory pili system protein ChpA (sensor histidine kinase/response regulator)